MRHEIEDGYDEGQCESAWRNRCDLLERALAACVESIELIPGYIDESMAAAGRADVGRHGRWRETSHIGASLRMAKEALAAAKAWR